MVGTEGASYRVADLLSPDLIERSSPTASFTEACSAPATAGRVFDAVMTTSEQASDHAAI
jgi:hypothetical protein